MYLFLRSIHVVLAAVTIAGFCLRAYWMIIGSSLLERRVTRVAPHIIDTLFLASGIALVILLGLDPMQHGWLLAKFGGLIAYIVLGAFALRRGRTPAIRAGATLAALAAFAYIVGVALSKSPQSWF